MIYDSLFELEKVKFNNYSELKDNFSAFGLTVDSLTGQTVDVKLPTTLSKYSCTSALYGMALRAP